MIYFRAQRIFLFPPRGRKLWCHAGRLDRSGATAMISNSAHAYISNHTHSHISTTRSPTSTFRPLCSGYEARTAPHPRGPKICCPVVNLDRFGATAMLRAQHMRIFPITHTCSSSRPTPSLRLFDHSYLPIGCLRAPYHAWTQHLLPAVRLDRIGATAMFSNSAHAYLSNSTQFHIFTTHSLTSTF